MSHCKQIGKDKVIFATKDDHSAPSEVKLPPPEPAPGLILPNGEINWNCPCLGGMATGPCGIEFRQAFSCFHYSEAEPKGSDCFDAFKNMQECFSKYPTVYNKASYDDNEDDADLENLHEIESLTESGKDAVNETEDITDGEPEVVESMNKQGK